MTLPFERVNAVNNTREFLRKLIDPKETPRIPKDVRMQALSLLRHYPSNYDMDRACEPPDSSREPVFDKPFWNSLHLG